MASSGSGEFVELKQEAEDESDSCFSLHRPRSVKTMEETDNKAILNSPSGGAEDECSTIGSIIKAPPLIKVKPIHRMVTVKPVSSIKNQELPAQLKTRIDTIAENLLQQQKIKETKSVGIENLREPPKISLLTKVVENQFKPEKELNKSSDHLDLKSLAHKLILLRANNTNNLFASRNLNENSQIGGAVKPLR